MTQTWNTRRRSGCPIAFTSDLIGDRWTVLVVRDLSIFDKRHFGELLEMEEGIATNVLTDRLNRLERAGVVVTSVDPDDRRRKVYTLTDAGLDLVPVLVAMATWGAAHDPDTDADAAMFQRAAELLDR